MHRLATVLTAASLAALPACTDDSGGSAAPEPTATPTTPVVAPSASPSAPAQVEAVVDDFLAAVGSDSERAWGLLSPQSQQTWGSFDVFADAESEFALGLAAFARARERTFLDVADDLLVVVLSGEVSRDGPPEYGAYALPLRLQAGAPRVELPGPELSLAGRADFDVPGRSRAPVEPGTEFSAYVPAEAAAVMWLDGREIPAEQTGADGDRTQLTATPDLTAGWHVVTVTAVRADGFLLAQAVAFSVS